jgi:hypothetical protein
MDRHWLVLGQQRLARLRAPVTDLARQRVQRRV